jgi:rhamnulokinase
MTAKPIKRRRAKKQVVVAAVDLGATSGRLILGIWQDQRLELRKVHRFPNSIRRLGNHDYWDLPWLWNEVHRGIHLLGAAMPHDSKVASIGVDTWGADHVLVNRVGRITFPPHAYRDARTEPVLRRLQSSPSCLARLYRTTGIPDAYYNTSVQLAELVETFPAIRNMADRCLFLSDYFNFLLSGQMANGLAAAGTSQLLDVESERWSYTALKHFGIPRKWFSPPIRSGTRIGTASQIMDINAALVLAVPGHDTTCAYDAIPSLTPGSEILISSGTWSLVGFESPVPLLGVGSLKARIANDRDGRGGYRPLINVSGLWLLERTLADLGARPETSEGWTNLIKAAEALPRPARLLDIGDIRLANPPSMKAAIDQQIRDREIDAPKTIAGYVSLICHSLAYGHAAAIRNLERLSGKRFCRVVIVGGGSRNRLLCQATADESGLPVISFGLEGSAVGNIANQLIGLSVVRDLGSFRQAIGAHLEHTAYLPRT